MIALPEPDWILSNCKFVRASAGILNNPLPSPLYNDADIEPLNKVLPLTTKLPELFPAVIVIGTFDTNPSNGDIDAVAEPLAIRGVSPERSAITPVNWEPSPK